MNSHKLATENSSKNFVLSRETEHLRNSIILPLAQAHRYLQSLGGEHAAKTNAVVAMSTTLDAVVGDNRSAEFIKNNSPLSFTDKEFTDLGKIFPRVPMDLAEIEGVFYDVIDAVQGLLGALGKLLEAGQENVRKVMILLTDFVGKLKRTMLDIALKVYMHTKIEMIIRNQSAIRAA